MTAGKFAELVAGARARRLNPVESFPSHEAIIERAWLSASAAAQRARLTAGADAGVTKPEDITGDRQGARFEIPLVIPEGLESGDGRFVSKGALSRRELPLPLLWQIHTSDGHDGSVVVGRIDTMERTPSGMGAVSGCFDIGEFGREAERLVRSRMMRFVSADLDKFEADESVDMGEGGEPKSNKLSISKARVMAVTLVAKPAFQECVINLIDEDEQDTTAEGDTVLPDGVYESESDEDDRRVIMAAAAIIEAVPVHPPHEWFANPNLSYPTAITVDDSGRVFGHIASWDMDHIGMPFGTRVPASRSKYAYFHTGVVRTAEGRDVPVGQLTLSGGHAPLNANAAAAVKHYDDTQSAIADVRAGEDAFGVWVAGALRPEATPEQIRAFRASSPSGDWRQIKGSLELVAVCQVNVPGFPVTRALAAAGAVQALVAAGAKQLLKSQTNGLTQTEERLQRLEAAENARLAAHVMQIKQRVTPAFQARANRERAALAAAAESTRERLDRALGIQEYLNEFKTFSPKKRDELAKKKHALPDGSFPIENSADLRRAVRAYGRASDGKKAAVRRHIIKRARGLGEADKIPDTWSEARLSFLEFTLLDVRGK